MPGRGTKSSGLCFSAFRVYWAAIRAGGGTLFSLHSAAAGSCSPKSQIASVGEIKASPSTIGDSLLIRAPCWKNRISWGWTGKSNCFLTFRVHVLTTYLTFGWVLRAQAKASLFLLSCWGSFLFSSLPFVDSVLVFLLFHTLNKKPICLPH